MMGVSAAPSFRKASCPNMELISMSWRGPLRRADEGLHVGERHQLVLAHRDQGRRRAHPRRIHLVQVDRFAQARGRISARYFCT